MEKMRELSKLAERTVDSKEVISGDTSVLC